MVFKVNPAGHETVLYTFTGGDDGGSPEAAVVRDATGNIYGTAYLGTFGWGVTSELTPSTVNQQRTVYLCRNHVFSKGLRLRFDFLQMMRSR